MDFAWRLFQSSIQPRHRSFKLQASASALRFGFNLELLCTTGTGTAYRDINNYFEFPYKCDLALAWRRDEYGCWMSQVNCGVMDQEQTLKLRNPTENELDSDNPIQGSSEAT